MVKITELLDYYKYLFALSWPGIAGLLAVSLFIIFRLVYSYRKIRVHHSFWERVIFGCRCVLGVAVLAIYLNMFFFYHQDWLYRPKSCMGRIHSLNISAGSYVIELICGEEKQKFIINRSIFERLNKGDVVQVKYLPNKKEVYICKVLTEQSINSI